MPKFIRMTDLDLKGRRVFIRADLNVPVKDGKVTSDARITASMPTIEHAMKAGAKVYAPSVFGGDKIEALSSLKRAIKLFESKTQDEWSKPNWGYLDALVWAGWAYEQTDRPAEARASYLNALSAEPRATWVRDLFLSPLEQKLEKKRKS